MCNGRLSAFGQRDSKVSKLGPDTDAIRFYLVPRVYLATWDTLDIRMRGWKDPFLGHRACTSSAAAQGGVGGCILSLEYMREGDSPTL